MTPSTREPIAVVGIGCRFPGDITTAKEFWETLCHGVNKVSDVPSDRFDARSLHDPDLRKYGAIRNPKGGFLGDISGFDAEFFNYFPAEASRIDPQQRLALEASFHALEDSGTLLEQVSGSRTSVFIATFLSDHISIQTSTAQRDNISPHLAMGASNSSIANRVSHRLNLCGPSVTLDTACSGSLVSLHLACQSLWTQESDAALAGGVNAIIRPESTIQLSKGGFLSPDGSCKSFDAAANGYVRSEGVGMVLLKPLKRALRDKDRIYALVRNSLVNQDGYTEGFAAPNPMAQVALLQSVYSQSGVDPAKVRYVEAHGPGTPVGDPIETAALGRCLGEMRLKEEDPLWIGSVKGNLGHLEGSAGIAGFIKAALVIYYGEIPPQINHVNPNPSIDFQTLRLAVPSATIPLRKDGTKCKSWVGVNSFGAGGTNAHAILEEPPGVELDSTTTTTMSGLKHGPRVFVLSTRSPAATEQAAGEISQFLKSQRPAMEDIAYTLNLRRSRHSQISVIPAQQFDELCHQLDSLRSRQTSKESLGLQKPSHSSLKTAFIFSGQGGQWLGMGMALAEQEPVFRDCLIAFDHIFAQQAGFSIYAEISNRDGKVSRLNQNAIVQPAVVAIQIALAKMLVFYGLKPNVIMGHSIGEVAAGHIAGALSLEDAVQVIYFRSQIQNQAAGCGTMLAVGISSVEARQLIQRHSMDAAVEVAALNSSKMTALTGTTVELEQLAGELEFKGIFARFVKVDVPYHSRFMDPLKNDIVESLSSIQGRPSNVDLYSTVTSNIESGTHLTGEYWFKNIREPVQYAEAASKILENGANFLVEIGPHPVLISGTRELAESTGSSVHILPALVRGGDIASVSRVIGAAHAIGIDVDIQLFNGGGGRLIDLPPYPFQRKSYWFEHPEAQQSRLGKSNHPFLGDDYSRLTDYGRGILRLRVSTGVSPFLSDHTIDRTIVFPMTGHIEAAYLAAKHFMPHREVWLQDLRFESPLVLEPAEAFAPQVLFEITSPVHDFIISSRQANSKPEASWQVCSRGRINAFDQRHSASLEDLGSVISRVRKGKEIDVEHFYKKGEESDLQYGESFRTIRNIWRLGQEILSFVELPRSLHEEANRFAFHPAFLDSCLHTLYADLYYHGDSHHVYLPYDMKQMQLFETNTVTSAFTHIRVTSHDDTFLSCDATIYGETGKALAEIVGFRAKRLLGRQEPKPKEYYVHFQPEDEDSSNRIHVDFENVVVADPEVGDLDWLSIARKTFPDARVCRLHADITEMRWFNTDVGFQLDRRTLLVVSALMPGPSSEDLQSIFGVVVRTLLSVGTWIRQQQGTPTVVVVTNKGCVTPSDTQCHPLSAAIEGAVRVMANEFPRARIRLVDLDLDQIDCQIQVLQDEIRTSRLGCYETVVAIRPEGRFFRRIMPVDFEEEQRRATRLLPARGGNYHAISDAEGSLDNITLRQHPHVSLGPDDVRVEVHAAGLNFKDVMNGSGLLREQAISGSLSGHRLGLEIAGQVVEIGAAVRDISLGDPVMARVPHGLAGSIVTNPSHMLPVPPSLSFPEASCIPVAFITAYYALEVLGRLSSGETVLIHSAAGGVGLAAMQIAKLCDARVFATAGSPDRRAWVSKMGAEAVFDSRSISFYDQVKNATDGRGVDVVLNGLSGAMLSQSLACLAPFGRFLELGKADIYQNMRVGLEQFGENRAFFAVDIDKMASQKPNMHRRILRDLCFLFERGKLQPLPITTYPVTQIPTALKKLSRSAIIGKVAVKMEADSHVHAAPPDKLHLREDRTYLVTGGASGLGLHLARLLSDRGARHIILMSRSGPKSADDNAVLSSIRHRGTSVRIEKADVSSAESVTSVFQRRDWPPVAGVLHCAGVLRDSYIQDTTMKDYWAVFEPKALGAWNLHLATQDMDLDFFVLISSVSNVLGLTGQFSYASANQFLDGLAHHRRMSGLPGLSLNLGVLGDFAGMSTRDDDYSGRVLEVLESQGLPTMSLPTVQSALESAILHDATQRLAASPDWSMFLSAYPHLTENGAFLGLKRQQGSADGSGSRQTLSNLPDNERIKKITDVLCAGLSKITGVEPNRISVTEKIDQYGFDSLSLTQMRSVILRELRIAYPVIRLMEGPSLEQIATELNCSFQDGPSNEKAPVDTTDPQAATTTTSISPSRLSYLSPWFVRGNSANHPHHQLMCFHPMGAGASFFSHFLTNPPDGLDIIAVQLPGREARADEAVPATVAEIVSNILLDMKKVGIPDIFWGHSFGGIIAFEVLRGLRLQGGKLPRLLLTGTIAPQLIHIWQKRDVILEGFREESSPEFLMAVQRYVGDIEFFRSILPVMRKDAPQLLSYRWTEEKPLDVPITAFAARQDDMVYPNEVAAWKAHTKEFHLVEVDGDHWFIHRNRQLLRETLGAMMGQ